MADTDIRHDKKVTVVLDTPLVNIGKHQGGRYNSQNSTTEFYGKVEVDEVTAQDLLRRQGEWRTHQNNLHRDNGQRDLNAGGFTGNQA